MYKFAIACLLLVYLFTTKKLKENIAKGTTDPRVEFFCLYVSLSELTFCTAMVTKVSAALLPDDTNRNCLVVY